MRLAGHGSQATLATHSIQIWHASRIQRSIHMAKLSPINQERLDLAHGTAVRLLQDLKSQSLRGKTLRRMKLIEQAVTCLETARIV